MLNRFIDLLFCGSTAPCGRNACTHWNNSIQDDGDLWKYLSLTNNAPKPQPPAIPAVVLLPRCSTDDVSTLYEGSLQQLRSEEFDVSEDNPPDDLELRVEDEEVSTELEVERVFFAELYSTPLKTCKSQRSLLDGDGSSYSTRRHKGNSWKTESTDATMETKNTFTTFLTNTQAMI